MGVGPWWESNCLLGLPPAIPAEEGTSLPDGWQFKSRFSPGTLRHGLHGDAVVHYLAFSDPLSSSLTFSIPSLLLWGGTPCYSPGKDEVNVFTWPLLVEGDCIFFCDVGFLWKQLSSTSFLLASMPLSCPLVKDCRVFWRLFVNVTVGISRLLPILALSHNVWNKTKQNKKQTSRDTLMLWLRSLAGLPFSLHHSESSYSFFYT